jgi:hypothetical protein
MKKYMDQSPKIRLMYAAQANAISNSWKKWQGENNGIRDCKVLMKKKEEEDLLQSSISILSHEKKAQYENIISNLKNDYILYKNVEKQFVYLRETFPVIALGEFIEKCRKMVNSPAIFKDKIQWTETQKKLLEEANQFYNSYYKPIDKECFIGLLDYYFNTLEKELMPHSLQQWSGISNSDLNIMADELYEKSIFNSKETFVDFISQINEKKLIRWDHWLKEHTLFYEANLALQSLQDKTIPLIKAQFDDYYRIYLKLLIDINPSKVKFPDANLTMRVTYGKMEGLKPVDGIYYLPYTTVAGILQKKNPDVHDYKVDSVLENLIIHKDFGRYADKNGEMRVAFIASNHTTGGNSGSPVLNGNGHLVGINFDRMWEGTMSDLNYDVSKCRNISLDIRYVLFITDKFANAQNIIKELEIQ